MMNKEQNTFFNMIKTNLRCLRFVLKILFLATLRTNSYTLTTLSTIVSEENASQEEYIGKHTFYKFMTDLLLNINKQ